MKKTVRVGMEVGEGGIVSYQLHNQRYLQAKIPVLYKLFREAPELQEMQLNFMQAERQKRRSKA